ncbi:MAG: DUF1573 domain-containing protein [Thermaerobacter sp.]|jgi:hypothetical protein|nr:DUF1573 domain-containing protein [Thermaerobacter sp.]MDA8145435.1 DUF1573 domain-containing protein [Thermaerobacter sp.]
MKDLLCDEFQASVNECLVRHKSVLDTLTKFQEATSRVNRSIAKAVTNCGCIKINAGKQAPPENVSLTELRSYMENHLEGVLCESCEEAVEREMGRTLFYMAALCNLLDLNLYDVLLKESKRLSTLGVFNFS